MNPTFDSLATATEAFVEIRNVDPSGINGWSLEPVSEDGEPDVLRVEIPAGDPSPAFSASEDLIRQHGTAGEVYLATVNTADVIGSVRLLELGEDGTITQVVPTEFAPYEATEGLEDADIEHLLDELVGGAL